MALYTRTPQSVGPYKVSPSHLTQRVTLTISFQSSGYLCIARYVSLPYQVLGERLPLELGVEQLARAGPLLADERGPALAPGHDARLERGRLDEEALGPGAGVWDGLAAGRRVDGPAEVERPQQPRRPQEKRHIRDVHALAHPPPRPEHEMVPLRRVRVLHGLRRRLRIVRPARRVEALRVRVPLRVTGDCPAKPPREVSRSEK